MKKIIHVNTHRIKAMHSSPLTVKTYKQNTYASHVDIIVNGQVVASIIYRPEKPLSCGARVWIETSAEVSIR